MNLAQLLARSARTFPERPAVMVGTRPLHTYAGLAARGTPGRLPATESQAGGRGPGGHLHEQLP